MSQVILSTTGSGTWTVPAGVTSATIELLGAGGNGGAGGFYSAAAGGGGEYSKWTAVSLTPGAMLSYFVGIGGGASGAAGGSPGSPANCDTWFSDPLVYFSQGGGNGGAASFSGAGGNYTSGGGDPATRHFGGVGGAGTGSDSPGGGGGAGGPNGAGAHGGLPNGGILYCPAGGGGGANGGAQPAMGSSQDGATGGNNRLGVGGGAGGLFNGSLPGTCDGHAGTAGGGGGGGGGYSLADTSSGNGGAGSTDNVWGGIYGPGGGGGGGGHAKFTTSDPLGMGGPGGQFGGGGGGGYEGSSSGGAGGQGLIVITYTGTGSEDGRGRVYTRYVKTKHNAPRPPPAPPPTAPVNTGAPTVNQARVGVVSTCSPGTWTGTAPITFSYQWKVDVSNVGTDSTTYTPLIGDVGKSLTCTVTATNTAGSASHASAGVTITNTVGPSIDIPDDAALAAAVAAWPTTGNKTWRLTGTNYSAVGAYNSWRFDSAPVVIDGLGVARFPWWEIAGASGFTLQNIIVNGANPSVNASMWVHCDDVTVMNLTFNNIVSDSGTAMGTQSGGGWVLNGLTGSTITINGQDDYTKPDVWGREFGIGFTSASVFAACTLNGITFDNIGINSVLGDGIQNVTVNRCLAMNNFYGVDDHPNAFHFFGGAKNITFTNNGVWQGLSGLGPTGIFIESVDNITVQNNWVLSGGQNGAFANSAGSNQTNDNNFAQGFGGWGGVMITRGGAVNTTCTNNTIGAIANYTADGTNPGYVPATLPGTNTTIPVASSITDTTYLNPWLAAHPTARPKPF